jgi:hypothetical protein
MSDARQFFRALTQRRTPDPHNAHPCRDCPDPKPPARCHPWCTGRFTADELAQLPVEFFFKKILCDRG